MLAFAYNTNGFQAHRLDDALDIIADLGYAGVGLTFDVMHFDPRARAAADFAALREGLERRRLRRVVETGARYLLDPRAKHQPTLLDPDPTARAVRLAFLKDCVIAALHLKAEAVSFWSGSPPAASGSASAAAREACFGRLVEGCRELCDFAAARAPGLPLAFEPEPGMLVERMDDFARLRAAVARPNLRLTLDVGHLLVTGEEPAEAVIRAFRGALANVHIEDMRRGVHEHLMLGEGDLDLPPTLAALTEIGYTGLVQVELSRHSHAAPECARQAMEVLRRASPSVVRSP
ncbi:MAG: sugar phosphate isomerase/epimerase [Planctomycetes bacterium]|nr:sugar phosphate isomerase/epimerase [Planctomycetota bacterium]